MNRRQPISLAVFLVTGSCLAFFGPGPVWAADAFGSVSPASKERSVFLAMDAAERAESGTQNPSTSAVAGQFKGYYKSLFTASRTMDSGEGVSAALQRLRLDGGLTFASAWNARLILDQNVILNDFAHTSSFDAVRDKRQKNLAFVDAEKVTTDRDHVYAATSVYRGYLKYDSQDWQMTLGKQAIDWGRTRFWSPMDLFHPISPLDIERDERVGVDALNIEVSRMDPFGLNVVYAPRDNARASSAGVRAYYQAGTSDIFVVGGSFHDDQVVGVGIDAYLGDSSIRGELTQTHGADGRHFLRGVLGMEHALTRKLSVIGEYFYNGGAEDNDQAGFLGSYDVSSRAMSMQKNFAGVGLSYEVTPLLKLDHYAIYDLDGKSLFYNPELRYSFRKNIDLTAGSQVFWGDAAGSEFGSLENLYYLQAKYYF